MSAQNLRLLPDPGIPGFPQPATPHSRAAQSIPLHIAQNPARTSSLYICRKCARHVRTTVGRDVARGTTGEGRKAKGESRYAEARR